jgi:phosphoglucosamine mutase
MKMKLFGTDGIRGRVNTYLMTPKTPFRLNGCINRARERTPWQDTVLIGKDTRLSGYMIESATSGICSMGMNVTLVVLCRRRASPSDEDAEGRCRVVISASTTLYDNGIKFFPITALNSLMISKRG